MPAYPNSTAHNIVVNNTMYIEYKGHRKTIVALLNHSTAAAVTCTMQRKFLLEKHISIKYRPSMIDFGGRLRLFVRQ